MKNGDELAYPHTETYTLSGEEEVNNHFGLTKREACAIAAMQGLLASTTEAPTDEFASYAVLMADALLKELSK